MIPPQMDNSKSVSLHLVVTWVLSDHLSLFDDVLICIKCKEMRYNLNVL